MDCDSRASACFICCGLRVNRHRKSPEIPHGPAAPSAAAGQRSRQLLATRTSTCHRSRAGSPERKDRGRPCRPRDGPRLAVRRSNQSQFAGERQWKDCIVRGAVHAAIVKPQAQRTENANRNDRAIAQHGAAERRHRPFGRQRHIGENHDASRPPRPRLESNRRAHRGSARPPRAEFRPGSTRPIRRDAWPILPMERRPDFSDILACS